MLIGLAVVSADEFLFSAARGATLLLLYVDVNGDLNPEYLFIDLGAMPKRVMTV